jgi:hypothetical protein
MASANSSYTDIIATTLEFRSADIADNVTSNNAAFAWMKANGGIKITSGGHKIVERLAFAENGNGGWYSGYDQLPVGAQEEISAAEFNWKQLAVPVVTSGLEIDVQNAGKEQVDDLLEEKIKNAERTAENLLSEGLFSDGTGTAGKQLTGLLALCDSTPTTTTYGGIDPANFAFWQNKYTDTGAIPTASTIFGLMNTMYYSLVRGSDKPDLVLVDDDVIGAYEAQLQTLQRFSDPGRAKLGFDTLKYKMADIVLDGNCTDKTAYFLNTKYLRLRIAKNRNFKPLKTRMSFNQDAEVVILAAALQLTTNNRSLQGRLEFTA